MDIIRGLISYAISTVTGKPRPLSVNGSDELIVAVGTGSATQDVNVVEIDGTTPTPNVAGHLPVESDIRQVAGSNVAATSVAGTVPVESDIRQVAGSNVAATSVAGTVPVETDHRQVAGSTIATTGVTGTFPIEGTASDAASSDASNPLKCGAVTEEVPAGTGIVDDEQAHLITDLLRRLWVRPASFSSLSNADQVENLNTIATDYDQTPQILASDTAVTIGAHYYPSSSGFAIGTRNNFCMQMDLTYGSFDIEVSNDQTQWDNATKQLTDVSNGQNGYDNTDYVEAAGGSATFAVAWEKCEFLYARILFTSTNNAATVDVNKVGRAH